ncbi:MAG: molecular chaperone DnaJ [Clostridia bacterium]|nr:molecular chaperone DnaJ [Clostridia bacterium]
MADKKNYYEVLGVDKNADDAAIKSAYRKLVKQYHPDLHPDDPTCAEKFKEINEANETLSDPQKRKQYDFELEHPGMGSQGGNPFSGGFGGAGFGGFSDIFDSFFGGGMGGGRREPSQGDDITRQVNLSFLDAVKGCTKDISYMRNDTCPSCKGTGAKGGTAFKTCDKCKGSGQVRFAQDTIFGRSIRVGTCPDCRGTGKTIIDKCPDCKGKGYLRKETNVTITIPAGADNQSYMRKRGYGQASEDGGEPGDLIITFKIEPHKILKREGNNLTVTVPISFTTAVLGGKVKVPGIDDAIEIDIPKGTQSGTVFTIHGKGVRSKTGIGDIIATVKVITPKNLSSQMTKKLKELDEMTSYKDEEQTKRYSDAMEGLYGQRPYDK